MPHRARCWPPQLLTTVRDLLRERSFPSGRGSGSALFGLLLPELSDQLLPNLTARPELLPRLILARATVRTGGANVVRACVTARAADLADTDADIGVRVTYSPEPRCMRCP